MFFCDCPRRYYKNLRRFVSVCFMYSCYLDLLEWPIGGFPVKILSYHAARVSVWKVFKSKILFASQGEIKCFLQSFVDAYGDVQEEFPVAVCVTTYLEKCVAEDCFITVSWRGLSGLFIISFVFMKNSSGIKFINVCIQSRLLAFGFKRRTNFSSYLIIVNVLDVSSLKLK